MEYQTLVSAGSRVFRDFMRNKRPKEDRFPYNYLRDYLRYAPRYSDKGFRIEIPDEVYKGMVNLAGPYGAVIMQMWYQNQCEARDRKQSDA